LPLHKEPAASCSVFGCQTKCGVPNVLWLSVVCWFSRGWVGEMGETMEQCKVSFGPTPGGMFSRWYCKL
jgi:hypothetical protein